MPILRPRHPCHAPGRHISEVHCRACAVSLHFRGQCAWNRGANNLFRPSAATPTRFCPDCHWRWLGARSSLPWSQPVPTPPHIQLLMTAQSDKCVPDHCPGHPSSSCRFASSSGAASSAWQLVQPANVQEGVSAFEVEDFLNLCRASRGQPTTQLTQSFPKKPEWIQRSELRSRCPFSHLPLGQEPAAQFSLLLRPRNVRLRIQAFRAQ